MSQAKLILYNVDLEKSGNHQPHYTGSTLIMGRYGVNTTTLEVSDGITTKFDESINNKVIGKIIGRIKHEDGIAFSTYDKIDDAEFVHTSNDNTKPQLINHYWYSIIEDKFYKFKIPVYYYSNTKGEIVVSCISGKFYITNTEELKGIPIGVTQDLLYYADYNIVKCINLITKESFDVCSARNDTSYSVGRGKLMSVNSRIRKCITYDGKEATSFNESRLTCSLTDNYCCMYDKGTLKLYNHDRELVTFIKDIGYNYNLTIMDRLIYLHKNDMFAIYEF